MTRRTYLSCLLLALSAPCLVLADTTIVEEDFESYADSSALYSVWSPPDGTTFNGQLVDENFEIFINLDDPIQPVGANAFPSGGQGVEHIGGQVLEYQPLRTSGPIMPTATQSIVLQGDIFDIGAIGNKRMSIGLRSSTPNNIVEIGHYNESSVEFANRTILFESPSPVANQPNWQFYTLPVELDRPEDADEITTLADIGETWSTHRVTITPTTVTYEIDLFRDGIDARTGQPGFDAEMTFEAAPFANGFDSLRIGGPSNVTSGGNLFYGGVIFDNISLKLVDVATVLVGDYNGDTIVDAADYTLWRDTLGDSVAQGSGADGNNNGVIDTGDYQVWVDNYGMTAGLSASLGAAPEPSAVLLLLAGCGAAALRRRAC
ncbi:MAG: PEP-CTERM sorting domain-containing protein [Planctomycetales bacterium]|nr:PEP-CTERM sorting domain-containing protein [Planctomycetales bacterium]